MTELQELVKYMDERPGKNNSSNVRITAPSIEEVRLSLAIWLMDKAEGNWDEKTLKRRKAWGKRLQEHKELKQRIATRIQAEMTRLKDESINKRGEVCKKD